MTDDKTAELVAISDAWAAAIVANDADLIASFMTDDWVIISETGVSPREHLLAMVGSGALTHSAMQRVGEPRIRVYGATVVVTARVTNTARLDGQRFDADEWTTDVFVREGGAWRCALSHITAARA